MKGDEIVISGFSGRFPSSDSIRDFEHNLYNGIDMVTIDDSRWPIGLWNLSPRNGKIPSCNRFDYEFFGIPVQDVDFIDPQERLILEVGIEAITDSGVSPSSLNGTNTGCFFGTCFKEEHENLDTIDRIPGVPGSVPTRLSKFLGLTGPICYVDTACGSSLSALNEAFIAMRAGVCDQAVVFGVNSLFRARVSVGFRDLGMINLDGKCKCLSSDADGYCRSESIAVLFLQKAKDASRIYATILNSMSNSDGFKEEGITFPSRSSQKSLIQATLKGASVDPVDVCYIEAHCTGTQAGDPVELNAIHDALCGTIPPSDNVQDSCRQKKRGGPLLIGCLKSNMGHTEGASGLCAIAKSLIVLEKKSIPPNLHFTAPNPHIIGLQDGSISGVNQVTPFPCPENPLVGINCFGFGGANTHVIMRGNLITEEQNKIRDISGKNPRLVLISGRTREEITAVLDQICQQSKSIESGIQPGFLHLLDRLATDTSHLRYRTSVLVQPDHGRNCYFVNPGAIEEGKKSIVEIDRSSQSGLVINLHSLDLVPDLVACDSDLKKQQELHEQVSDLWNRFKSTFLKFVPTCFLENHFLPWMMEWNQISGRILDQDKESLFKSNNVNDFNQDMLMALFVMNVTVVQFLVQELNLNPDQIKCGSRKEGSQQLVLRLIKNTIKEGNLNGSRIQLLKIVSLLTTEGFNHEEDTKSGQCSFLNKFLAMSDTDTELTESGTIEVSIGKSAEEFLQTRNEQQTKNHHLLIDLISWLCKTNAAVQGVQMTNMYPYHGQIVPVGTPMVNSLIRWNHERKFDLKLYCSQWSRIQSQNSTNVNFHFDRRILEHEFLFDHVVDGRVLFPATGYLMMAWIAYTKLHDFSVTPIFENPIKFKDVQFLRASVMNLDKETDFTVKINQDSGRFTILEGLNDDPIVTGIVTRATSADFAALPQNSVQEGTELASKSINLGPKDIYKELRVRGYDYGLLFQGIHNLELDSETLKTRSAKLIWRQVVKKSVRELASDSESLIQFWTKNWIPFVDSLLQVSIIESGSNRGLFVPTFLQSLVCFPELLENEGITNGESINDAVSGDEGSLVMVTFDRETSSLSVPGLCIKGLETSPVSRRNQTASIKSYTFDTFFNESVLEYHDTSKGMKELEKEIDEYWKQLEKNVKSDLNQAVIFDSDKFYDFNRYALLHGHGGYDENGNIVESVKVSTKGDLLVGNYSEIWPQIESPLLELQLDTVITSVIDSDLGAVAAEDVLHHITEVSILELTPFETYQEPKEHFLSESFLRILDENVFYDKFDVNYSISSIFEMKQEKEMKFSDSRISKNKLKPTKNPENNLVLLNLLETDSKSDLDNVNSVLDTVRSQAKDFILILCKDVSVLSKHIPTDGLDIDSIIEKVTSENEFVLISCRSLDTMHPLKSVLFKRIKRDLKAENQIVIDVGMKNESVWLPKLQDAINSVKSSEDKDSKRIWIRNCKNEPFSGVHGLVKTLRLEHPSIIRGIMDMTCTVEDGNTVCVNEEKIFEDPKYQELLKKDLVLNVKLDPVQGWGSFVHFPIPEKSVEDTNLLIPSLDSVLKMSKPGDLTSFFWSSKEEPNSETRTDQVRVIYAPLNFKDVMYATGGLPPPSSSAGSFGSIELPLGLEFSGIEEKEQIISRRVMGLVPKGALASKVTVPDADFVWTVPDHWSLEEAASVPVVYATAYYALILRGKLTQSDRVLIHSAAGGVGLAALNICIKRGISRENLFITVGSEEKKRFLLDTFGSKAISPENVFSSRSSEFEYQLLSATEGKGVDIILNCLAGSLLRASLRVLAPCGRFCEIGKVDFVKNSLLDTIHDLGDNRSFHGILLDSLFVYNSARESIKSYSINVWKERQELRSLISEGIKSGEVQPLFPRTVFDRDDVERGFRFMTTGQHVGKVILKLDDDPSTSSDVSTKEKRMSVKSGTCFDPDKVVIIVGALGGLGLELVHWIVAAKGVRKLVIVSRTGIRNDYQEFCMEKIRKLGAQVLIVSKTNCSTKQGAEEVIKESLEGFPGSRIGSIFSIATLYKDLLIVDQNPDEFKRVVEPKADITVHLDTVCRELNLDLDHFVCFSSASCGRGNPGQSSYNVANGIMESVCHKRSQEQKGVSIAIQWGVIGDVGIVAESVAGQNVVLLGSRSQRIPSVFGTLDRILGGAAVTKKNVSTVLDLVKAGRRNGDNGEGRSGGGGQDLIKSICHIMGIKDISSIDGGSSLGSLGIDSLIAIEIKQTLERTATAKGSGTLFSLKQIRDLTLDQLVALSNGGGG